MKVFVAGPGGAIGRPLIPRLVEAGHRVTGTTRSAERGEEIRALGECARRVPLWLARLIAGGFVATMSTTLGGASNAKAKRELDWAPR